MYNGRKTALVTGSARGIGRAIILELAKANYNCIIHYNTSIGEAESLQNEIQKYGIDSFIVKADISNDKEVDNIVKEITNKFGGIDILINNAAVDLSDFYKNKTIDNFKKTIDVNLIGVFNVTRKLASYMVENKWGRIINISSTNGMNTYYPITMEYDCSKAALNQLTHCLAIEYSPYVTVNAIAPGFIGTESELDGYNEVILKEETEKILLKRFGKPEEVAHLVKFLVSDEAQYINNSIIRIDGGQLNS